MLLIRTSLPYLGYEINGVGIKAIVKHNLMDQLLQKKHQNLLHLQQTAETLNYYQKFLLNHSQLIYPIHAAIKAIGLYDLTDDTLDQIVYPVVLKVKEHLNKQMILFHPDYEAEKHFYIYVGELAFACAFWQKSSHGKKELIEYQFKTWMNKVTNYSEKEKFALATCEAIKHHAALMQVALQTYIYTSNHSFTTIATHPEMRTSEAAHYLISAMTYRITFLT